VLARVSLASLHAALAAHGPPVAVLHVLCHGGRLGTQTEAYGLVWNAGWHRGPRMILRSIGSFL
jgi:hypothetical protein